MANECETLRQRYAALRRDTDSSRTQVNDLLRDVDALVKAIRHKLDGGPGFGTVSVVLGHDDPGTALSAGVRSSHAQRLILTRSVAVAVCVVAEEQMTPDLLQVHSSVQALRTQLADDYADRLGTECATQ